MPLPLRKLIAGAGAAAALAVILPAAASADPVPFGHACTPQNDVRFCPTTDLATRPHSFDGTPIDVDVTLPATGNGPFPTILLLHGLGGTKTSFEGENSAENDYTNWAFAKRGYAVIAPTARGFGGSCGNSSKDTPDCGQGWTRLGDMRYEVRDVQTLVGQLVDQGIVKPDAIGATGISYGGGFSTMLAFLKNRVRLPNGDYAPWTSPSGTPISLAAAWPRWMWSNGEGIFVRNGRAPWSRTPTGVTAASYAGVIFAVAIGGGNVAPTGGDLSTDISLWKRQLDAGVFDASTRATLDNAFNYHGVSGLTPAAGGPSPLLMQSGWTDALFPVGQALGAYDAVRKANPAAPVALQIADSGHGPGVNHPTDVAAFDAQGLAFFDAWLKGGGAGSKPAPGSVTAYTMVCPASLPAGGGPFKASSFGALERGSLRLSAGSRKLRITSKGGSATLATAVTGAALPGALCKLQKPDPKSKALIVAKVSRGATLLGRPVITGRAAVSGRYGQIDARVWDLFGGKQRLITRGVYRLKDNEKGPFTFTLDGNGWRFAPGHRVVVELLGRDSPTYGASITPWTATLTGVRVKLPVREKPSRKNGIAQPF
jgi:pimeloyl-ACP methyl ester carboxylesterase